MFELSTIVISLDSSSVSRAVLDLGARLASAYDARLHAAHVVPEMPPLLHRVLFPYAAMGEDELEFQEELIGTAQRDLQQELEAVQSNGQPPTSSVVYGPVAEALHRVLLGIGPDLVVMGAHGDSGARRNSLGSTVERMLQTWRGRLLLVREGAISRGIGRIMVATDFGAGAEILLAVGAGLAMRTGARLGVISVIPDLRLVEAGNLTRGAIKIDANAVLGRARRNAEQHLKRVMTSVEVPFPMKAAFNALDPQLVVAMGETSDEISKVISEMDDALVVVGHSQRREGEPTPIGRTAETIVRRVPAHVLISPLG